jgi:hypothetical protein
MFWRSMTSLSQGGCAGPSVLNVSLSPLPKQKQWTVVLIPNRAELGRATWRFLHLVTLRFPDVSCYQVEGGGAERPY